MDPSADAAYGQKFSLYLWGLGDTVKARVFAEQHPDRGQYQLHMVRREYEQALDIIRSHNPEQFEVLYPLYLSGRSEEARALADSVALREWVTSSESMTATQLAWAGSYRGLAHAFAGEVDVAVREGEEALEIYPVASDQNNYWIIVQNVCHIYLLTGDYEAAIDQLEVLLSTPTKYTAAWLRLDPIYDPLRDHPRFQALLEKYGSEH
jgi:serine/threonine-protein kinase